jgi:Family of unknown function (DUF5689)/Secretion system C-terminal sorting domain
VVVSSVDGLVSQPLAVPDSLRLLRRYYIVGNVSGITAFTADFTLSYADTDLAAIGVTRDSSLHVYQFNGSNWVDLPVSARDVANNAVTVSGVSSFGTFALGLPGPKKVTIAEARKDVDNNFVPDHLVTGDTLLVYGVITSHNLGSTYTSYYMQDSTAGINVYRGGAVMPFSIGDSVFVIGTIKQNKGLTEISPLLADSVHFGILKHGAVVPKPNRVTLHQYVVNAETLEGTLVEIDSLYKASGTWASGQNVYMTNAAHSDTTIMYINGYTNVGASAEHNYPINLVGIASQYTSSVPANNGYEIIPRDSNDVTSTRLAKEVTIAEARKDDNHDLIPDYKISGDTLKIFGVITSPNFQASTGKTEYYIQDSTGGIDVYKSGAALDFAIGDSVFVVGTITQFNGLTEISPLVADSAHFGLLGYGAKVPAPKVLLLHDYLQNAEAYEGQLVEIDTLFKASGTWPAAGVNGTLYLRNTMNTDTVKVFLDLDAPIAGGTEPEYPVNVIAIASQYSSTSLSGNYELMVRDSSDIKHVVILGVNERPIGIPKDFYLSQNYPNPFNPTTTIEFGLPKESQVRVEVFNVLGQRVALLVDGAMKAGNHRVAFNGGRFASGMYFYVMRAGDRVFKQKMLMIK